jgi:SAM-dependent methyltransferase
MTGAGFRDHFSGAASAYARFRPRYPDALFDWLLSQVPSHLRAWDCGTGSGQAATVLAKRFALVVATDASIAQLTRADAHPRVRYVACTAECAPLRDGAVSLVTVAQALHWFDTAGFFAEARRTLVRGGVIAAWTYGNPNVADDAACDRALAGCLDAVEAYWPPERAHVLAGYGTIPFPFVEITAPTLSLEQRWTLDELTGYVGTWSAVLRYRQAVGEDPAERLRVELTEVWGDPAVPRLVRWPLAVRAGRAD